MLTQLCPTLCEPMDCSPPGSSVHGIVKARILEGVSRPSSRGYSSNSYVFCISRGVLYHRATRGSPGFLPTLYIFFSSAAGGRESESSADLGNLRVRVCQRHRLACSPRVSLLSTSFMAVSVCSIQRPLFHIMPLSSISSKAENPGTASEVLCKLKGVTRISVLPFSSLLVELLFKSCVASPWNCMMP